MKFRNENEQTDQFIAGIEVAPVIKTADSYNNPGMPTPPAGWGRKLPTDEESMEKYYPDLCDND